MRLSARLNQLIDGARRQWRSRDPNSYSHYESERDYERKQTDHARSAQEQTDARAREALERRHGFEARYAAEHEREPDTKRSPPPG
jgi:hypothetical protein